MPVVQGNIPGSAVFVPNEIEGAEDAVESVCPFLIDTKNNSKPARKKLIRRDDREYSQPLRFAVQLFFVALNLWIGVQFYLWVRWAESGGRALEVSRPAGVEGWLPIEGLMQSKYFLFTGQVPRVHAAGFFLFVSFLIISFVFRKSFCSWLCPVGTVSEFPVAALGRHRAALAEVRRAERLRLRGDRHVGSGHRRIPQQSVCAHCRRADAEFLPLPRRHDSIRCPWASDCIDLRAELLVSLSVPVRRLPGTGLAAQPGTDHP